MKRLNPKLFRAYTDNPNAVVTRDNVERLLDAGHIQVAMSNGRWWTIRRNGKTQTWKTDANRIRIPFKAGLKTYGQITETDFVEE